MSQEPTAEDVQQDAVEAGQTPLEEVRETERVEEQVGVEGDVLNAEDVEKVESPESIPLEEVFEPPAARPPAARESTDDLVRVLRKVREDVGQICELSSEEEKVVEAFSLALLRLMRPLARAIPVDPSALPRELGEIERANIIPKGDLIVLYSDGRMESIDLGDEKNRDLLVGVVRNVLPKFNGLVAERRARLEKRMDFLAAITKELQNIAEAFSSAIG